MKDFVQILTLLFLFASLEARALLLSKFIPPPNARIGMSVGTFDPVTLGHNELFENALGDSPIDYLVVVPNNDTPWLKSNKPNVSPFQARLDMLILAYRDHPKIIVADIPFETPTLAQAVRDRLVSQSKGQITLSAVVGTDVAQSYDKIPESLFVKTDFLIVHHRPPFPSEIPNIIRGIPVIKVNAKETKNQSVSATQVRQYLNGNDSFFKSKRLPSQEQLPLLPKVARYIRKNNLYHSQCADLLKNKLQ